MGHPILSRVEMLVTRQGLFEAKGPGLKPLWWIFGFRGLKAPAPSVTSLRSAIAEGTAPP